MLSAIKKASELTDEMIMITNDTEDIRQSSVLYANNLFEEFTGRKVENLDGKILISEDIIPEIVEHINIARRKKESYKESLLIRNRSAEYVKIHQIMIPLHDENNDEWFFVHKIQPLSDEEAIKKTFDLETWHEFIQNQAKVGLWEWYPKTDNALWTNNIYQILGYDRESVTPSYDLYGDAIIEEDTKKVKDWVDRCLSGNTENEEIIQRIRNQKTGKIRCVKAYAKLHVYSNGDKKLYGIVQDITEFHKKQNKWETLLEEKKILMQEIHHRVKNNLMIISGLLELQKSQMKEINAIEALRKSQLRIQAMGKVHEHLYRGHDLSTIKTNDFISQLLELIQESYGVVDITFDQNIQAGTLDINSAIALGLMYTELIINAIKHAFPENSTAKKIEISLLKDQEYWEGNIKDNGTGLPKKLDINEPSSLGFTLINLLVKQLMGELNIESSNSGSEFTIRFPNKYKTGSASNLVSNSLL